LEVINTLFGQGTNLDALQMGCRAFVMFFITLGLIRLSGMRAFGTKSAFDNIIVIMLGAVLSRAVIGASPFFPTVVAGFVLCLTHKVIAIISMNSDIVSDIVKTKSLSLYKDGKLNKKNMRLCELTMGDLICGVRHNANIASIDEAEEIFMERTGQISVVKKKE